MECTLFRRSVHPTSGEAAYTASIVEHVLWQEISSLSFEGYGRRAKQQVRVFMPLETEVSLGDKLVRDRTSLLPTEAFTVSAIYVRDFGSDSIRHKEVHGA